jgi:hypothetical protein
MLLSELIEKANNVLAEKGDLAVYIELDFVGFDTTQGGNESREILLVDGQI